MEKGLRQSIFNACIEIVKEKRGPFQKTPVEGQGTLIAPLSSVFVLLYRRSLALELRLACDEAKLFTQEPIPTLT
jgi:hypothetical protein